MKDDVSINYNNDKNNDNNNKNNNNSNDDNNLNSIDNNNNNNEKNNIHINNNYEDLTGKKFNTLLPSKFNKNGNTKTFNLFLASIKEIIKNNLNFENDILLNKNEQEKENLESKFLNYKYLWEFTKFLLRERMSSERVIQNEKKYLKNNMKNEIFIPLLDSYTIATAIDCCNLFNDDKLSNEIFYYQYKLLSFTMSVPPQRVVQAFLRSFQSSTQLYELDKFVKNILLLSPQYKFQFSGNFEKRNSDEIRTFDEIINAYLRCGNLPISLEIASMKEFNGFSDSALRNILIHFDRYWRDYDSETVYINDLLKGLLTKKL